MLGTLDLEIGIFGLLVIFLEHSLVGGLRNQDLTVKHQGCFHTSRVSHKQTAGEGCQRLWVHD